MLQQTNEQSKDFEKGNIKRVTRRIVTLTKDLKVHSISF